MLRLALLSLLLAAAAQAQDREPPPLKRGLVGTAGVLTAIGAAAGTASLLGEDNDDRTGVTLVVLSYGSGMALGTVLAAEALGLDAPLGTVLVDAALGVAVGAAAGGVVGGLAAGAAYLVFQDDWGLVSGLVGIGAGSVTALTVSSMVASRRVEAAPTSMRAPMGEPGVGLMLSISL